MNLYDSVHTLMGRGGTPSQVRMGGVTTSQVWIEKVALRTEWGTPQVRTGWGTLPGQDWMGSPPTPGQNWMGYPPWPGLDGVPLPPPTPPPSDRAA